MSTKNSAEDKLIASIQKTRSGGEVKAKPKTVTKKAAKKKAVASKKTRSGATHREQKQVLIDTFQTGRRVWPD